MRKQITILSFALLLFACNNGPKKQSYQLYQSSRLDTAFTIALYYTPDYSAMKIDKVFRIIRDTMVYENADTTDGKITQKLVKQIDSFYYVPLIDTLKDKAGKIKLDSTKKPAIMTNFHFAPNDFIVFDFNKRLKYKLH